MPNPYKQIGRRSPRKKPGFLNQTQKATTAGGSASQFRAGGPAETERFTAKAKKAATAARKAATARRTAGIAAYVRHHRVRALKKSSRSPGFFDRL
jgi:hypothetical protein